MKGKIQFTMTLDVEIPDRDKWSSVDLFDAIANHFQEEAERMKTAKGQDRWPEATDGMSGSAASLAFNNDKRDEK